MDFRVDLRCMLIVLSVDAGGLCVDAWVVNSSDSRRQFGEMSVSLVRI